MTRFLFYIIIILLCGCRSQDSKILFTTTDTVGFTTVHDSTQIGEIFHPGDTLFAHNVPVLNVQYTVQANTQEQWRYAWKHGDVWLMILGIVIFGVVAYWFIRRNDAGTIGEWSVGVLILAMLIGLGIAGTSLGWWDGYEAHIPKSQYDYYMQKDGNLNEFFHEQLK